MAWIDKTDQSRVFEVRRLDSQCHKSTLFIFSFYTFLWAYVVAIFIAFQSVISKVRRRDISHKTRGLCLFSFWVFLLLNLLWKNNRRRLISHGKSQYCYLNTSLVKNICLRYTALEKRQNTKNWPRLLSWSIHDPYWISQQLGPSSVTWKDMSFSCLKMTMSPTRRSCARANSFQPSVSLRPSSIFTFQVISDASDLSFAVFLWSFLPSICLEKKATGIFWSKYQIRERETCLENEGRDREKECTKWVWKPGRRGWKKCLFAILIILSNTRKERWTVLTQTLD